MFDLDLMEMCNLAEMLGSADNDLDSITEMILLVEPLQEIASIGDDVVKRNTLVIDDTTNVYLGELIKASKELAIIFDRLGEEFLGISEDDRKNLTKLMGEFLLSYSLILFKVVGYEVIATGLATGVKSLAELTLPEKLFGKEETYLMQTLDTILKVFQESGAYFAEYEVASQETLDDLLNLLEAVNPDAGTLKIAHMTKEEASRRVKKIESGGLSND